MKVDTRVNGPWSDSKIYQGKDLPTTLWKWQQDVMDRCKLPADDRRVNYVFDPKGNMGKSKFVKYMAFHHQSVMLPWGRTGDLLNLVCKLGARNSYFFDLSRTKPQDWGRDDISAAMEQIKNGYIVNLKYETGAFFMDPPHVWCFSNQPPNMDSMSYDRWYLWTINDLHELVRIKPGDLKRLAGHQRSRSLSPDRDVIDLE